ncbi:hypothetical protein [Arthrobacter sp. 2MCAF14]|uniref:hypothetical protein n=1 Tax=Arthrobacter sp. 2MCAF14 TaxID=3232982 RepID=UPI003F915E14
MGTEWNAVLGHFLVNRYGVSTGDSVISIDGPFDFLVPPGFKKSISAQTFFQDVKVGKEKWTSTGTESSPSLTGLVQVREVAKGMQANAYVVYLVVVDPQTLKVLSKSEIYRGPDEKIFPARLVGSNGSVVAVDDGSATTEYNAASLTRGLDVMTGKELWRHGGRLHNASEGNAVVMEITGESSRLYTCNRLSLMSVETGSVVLTLDDRTINNQHCNMLGAGFFGPYLQVVTDQNKYQYFDIKTGAPRTLPEHIIELDPVSGLILAGVPYNSYDTSPNEGLGVIDPATGTKMYWVDFAQVRLLKLGISVFYDGLLYLGTTDGKPVVDARSGKTVSDNDGMMPILSVDAFVLWNNGKLYPQGDRPAPSSASSSSATSSKASSTP